MNTAVLPSAESVRNTELERCLERSTWHQIRSLRVEQSDERIVIRGRAESYYAVQLMVCTLLHELASSGPRKQIDLDIRVSKAPPLRRPGWNCD